MHYKHLSLALLMVMSAAADRIPARSSVKLPPLSDTSLPSSRSRGGSSPSTNVWDHVSDTNAFKKMCTGPKRNQTLCNELEDFYRTAQMLGAKTKEKLQVADQKNALVPLTAIALDNESQEEIDLAETGYNAITLKATLQTELERIIKTMPNLTERDITEALIIAPIINFACNAGTTRREQKSIFKDVATFMMMKNMAEQQQETPMDFSL